MHIVFQYKKDGYKFSNGVNLPSGSDPRLPEHARVCEFDIHILKNLFSKEMMIQKADTGTLKC